MGREDGIVQGKKVNIQIEKKMWTFKLKVVKFIRLNLDL